MKYWYLPLIFVACSSPKAPDATQTVTETPKSFGDYWYSGGAEITSYELEQARYGEMRKGKAVTVFVTEPFSKSKQVKLDNYQTAGDDKVSVLKLNMMKDFITGIYPYTLMMSTFTPLDGSPMLKSATSTQEWCGHTFFQLNKQDSGYRWTGFSYFEAEGDASGAVDALSEDQLWTTLRLDPQQLPTGTVRLLPAAFYLRLKHKPVQPVEALAQKEAVTESDYSTDPHWLYRVTYPDRELRIYYTEQLPYDILGWEETYNDGPGLMTTKAKRIATMRSKYWQENSNGDLSLRGQLGLRLVE